MMKYKKIAAVVAAILTILGGVFSQLNNDEPITINYQPVIEILNSEDENDD